MPLNSVAVMRARSVRNSCGVRRRVRERAHRLNLCLSQIIDGRLVADIAPVDACFAGAVHIQGITRRGRLEGTIGCQFGSAPA